MAYEAVVSDTHPLVFHATASRLLGRRASAHLRASELRKSITYVPAAVIWELGLLVRVGKVDLGRSMRLFCEDLFSNPAFQFVELSLEQLLIATERRPNDDPFDGLICACSLSLGIPLITRDRVIVDSGLVKTVW